LHELRGAEAGEGKITLLEKQVPSGTQCCLCFCREENVSGRGANRLLP
jgi:hypothetical protein